MQEYQFRWTLENRRVYAVRPAIGGGESGSVLRDTTRQLRRIQRAERFLARWLSPELAACVCGISIRERTLVIEVVDPTAAAKIRRQSDAIRRTLLPRLGGLERLSIAGGDEETRPLEDSGTSWS